jgi:two-component system chemotaxis response regulator CheY
MILIVDDNMNFVDRMIGLLQESGNNGNITVAGNYEEARKILSSEKPDVVLLDINLPGKNGIELLKQIRLHNQPCEVIMITNHADEYYRQQCKELGAKHFLDKSNDFAIVPSLISQFGSDN